VEREKDLERRYRERRIVREKCKEKSSMGKEKALG
jgi:hypothetical protein